MDTAARREVNKLKQLRKASFLNGVKYFFDSAVMLAHRSYTSATFLAIHSQEELSKFHIYDHWSHQLGEGNITVQEIQKRLKGQVFDHVEKQSYFQMIHGNRFDLERLLDAPTKTQRTRNNALYVSYIDQRQIVPSRKTTKKTAHTHIHFTMCALMDMLSRAYVKQHNGSPPDDLGLDENTIMQDLCMVDQLLGDIKDGREGVPIDENLLSYFYHNSIEDNKTILENSYKLCVADANYSRLKNIRKFVRY